MYYIYDFYRGEFHPETFATSKEAKEKMKRMIRYRKDWKLSYDFAVFRRLKDRR